MLTANKFAAPSDFHRAINRRGYHPHRISGVLRRAERIQEEAQRRLEEVKYQAQKQAEETRKAAASAAWWLFATAVTSGIFSAIAGGLAVASNVVLD